MQSSRVEFLLCPRRTTLDLGIVKKSMVVDDVSPKRRTFLFRCRRFSNRRLTVGVSVRVFPPQWFPLKDTPSGRVHFKLEWLTLLPSTDQLEQVLSLRVALILVSHLHIRPLKRHLLTMNKSPADSQKE